VNDRNDPPKDFVGKAMSEIAGMARQGFDHPSTKPVLTGAALGAVAGALLPLLTLPLGAIAGAGFAFWNRLKN
jgi:hypothetical protein